MKKGKKLLALIVAVSLVAGLAPVSSTSYAEETEATLNETLVFEDDFEGDSWNSSYWNYTSEKQQKYVDSFHDVDGDGDKEATLGWYSGYASEGSRNMYKSNLSDVHMSATVCVSKASASAEYAQYHLLYARGENNAANSIAFGFETQPNGTASSLVIIKYGTGKDISSDVYYRTDAKFAFETEYKLDLFVVDSIVVAKCGQADSDAMEIIYAAVLNDISTTSGKCGIVDKYATTVSEDVTLKNTGTYTYGTDYTKNGYFDDFSISTITFDGFSVNGPVVVDQTGAGVADITVSSGGVEVADVDDVVVNVSELAEGDCGLYKGAYEVNCVLSGNEISAVTDRVFVVDDVDHAVTSMADARWDGATTSAVTENPNFDVDGLGKATLINNNHSILSMQEDDTAYGNFYVEYTLNVSTYEEQTYQYVYTRFNVAAAGAKATSYSADVLYDPRTDREFFYARLYHWCTENSDQQEAKGTYANSGTTNDIPLGTDMKIGFLVYNNTVKYTLNSNVVKEYTATDDSHLEGWFAIAKEGNTSSVVTVDDFLYVPLDDVRVNVENFDDGDGTFATWSTKTNVSVSDSDGNYKVTAKAGAELKSVDTFQDGYIEANIAVNEWLGSDGTYYPMELYCKRASSGSQRAGVRFKVIKSSDSYTAELQLVVREGTGGSTHTKTIKKLDDFALGKEYLLRLTCIGNYVEARLCNAAGEDDVLQYVFKESTLETVRGTYGFVNDSSYNVTATLDDLKVVEYITHNIQQDVDKTVSLPTYPFVNATNTQGVRTKFATGETVVLTVPEGQQLEVGGLTYTLDSVTDSATYSVYERLYDKDENSDICNQFKFEMPSSDITLSAAYYDGTSGTANIGARDTGIRESEEGIKRGLRFSSRAYTTYISGETKYTLKEVGTLLFNGDADVDSDVLEACYATRSSEENPGLYYQESTLIGKCVPATKALNRCDDFWDWGVVLTYEESYEDTETNLYEKKYQAYAYAVYVDSEDNEIVQYASSAKSAAHSYNAVAEAIGWATY